MKKMRIFHFFQFLFDYSTAKKKGKKENVVNIS